MTPATPRSSMQSGTLLGERYTLGEELGAGASGSVWTGHDTIVDRPVTVKILKPALADDDTLRERFRHVALKVAGLAIPGIVDVYDCLEEPGPDGGFLVCHITEQVEGRSLRDILADNGTLPYPVALALVADAARALHAAHREGIVHGNLKPENLIIGDSGTVTIVDFGFLPPEPSPYTAPELADDAPAVDVYGLGAVVYECLTGQPPAADGDISPLLNDMYPADAAPIMKAMSPQASHRFASVIAFADACRHTDPAHEEPPDPDAAEPVVLELELAPAESADDAADEEPKAEASADDAEASEPGPDEEPPAEADEPPAEPAEAADEAADSAEDATKVMATAAAAVPAEEADEPELDADDPLDPDADESGRSRRTLLILVVGVLVIVLTLTGAAVYFTSSRPPSGSPASPDPTSESSKSSASQSSSSASEVDRSPNSAEPAPTTSSPSPSDSPDGDKVQVPNVVGDDADAAEDELTGKGFIVVVNSTGEGRWDCRVHDQSPAGGKSVPAGSTVSFSYRKVHTPQQCFDF